MDARTQAAQSLRDDPTFDGLSWVDKLAEARFAAQAVNLPPDVATLEAIVGLADILTTTPPPSPSRVRAADPKAPPVVTAAAPRVELAKPTPKAAPVATVQHVEPPGKPALISERQSILYRFKVTTGVADAFIAELLNIPRSTVQACISRRVKENLTQEQKQLIRENLEAARSEITELLAELAETT